MPYEESKTTTNKEAHLASAIDMANDICNESPERQNAMVKQIQSIVKERRQKMIDEGHKNIEWLIDTIKQLNN